MRQPLAAWFLGAALGAAALGVLAPPVRAAESASTLVEDAGRKMRARDVSGAIQAAQKALEIEPDNPDAHVLFQDASREALGVEELITTYRRKFAEEHPESALYGFLYSRLLPWEQAQAEIEKQTLKFKKSPWPLVGKARLHERRGQFNESIAAYEEAIVRAGASPDAQRFRAMLAYGLERASRWPEAVAAWQRVAADAPQSTTAQMGLGECLRKTGDHKAALELFQGLASKSPADAEPVYRIALTHLDARAWDESVKAAEQVLKLDRGNVPALCAAAEASVKKFVDQFRASPTPPDPKDMEIPLGYANRAVASDPESSQAHFTLGAVFESLGEWDAAHLESALTEYEAALDLLPLPGPEKVRVLNAKSYVMLRLARWEDAQAVADKALEIDPQNAGSFAHGGHALCAMGQPKEAIDKYYKPATKIHKDDARLLHGRGTALWDLKKHNDAVKDLKDAVRLEPKSGRYRLSLGEIYYELRKYKESVEELFEATELLPRSPEAWSVYARACCAAKYYKEGIEAYEKVIELDSESVYEHLYAAILYDRLKDRKKAREHVVKFDEKGGWDDNLNQWLLDLLDEGGEGGEEKKD